MAASGASPAEMISQLDAARKLALGDAQVYLQVVPGIIPIIGPSAAVEVRRWGADFVAEAFSTPSLSNSQKEQLLPAALPLLKSLLDNPSEDSAVVRSVVQASASIYPLVFKRIISHPDQLSLWQDTTAVKLNILQRMDTAPVPVRICCVKFIQKVVHVETPALITDPRRPEQNETSTALVPRNHPLLPLPNLEAEASGLLDRLLGVFQDNSNDPIMIDATLNCLAVLIRTRPAVSNKILAAVLNFNPLKQATPTMTPRLIVIYKSTERTTRALLRYILRAMPNHPMEQKIQAYLMRLQQSKGAFFSDSPSLKRPAEPTDGLDHTKRQRLTSAPPRFPPMPPPPNTVAQLFTLTPDQALSQFDVKMLPEYLVNSLAEALLRLVDEQNLEQAVAGVRGRLDHLQKLNQPTPIPDVPMAGPTGIDDDDDYDPEFGLGSDSNAVVATDKGVEDLAQPAIDLGPFELPKPLPLTGTEVVLLSDQTVSHVFGVVMAIESSAQASSRQKTGINRLAASANDRDAWVTILTRLATRASSSLDEYDDQAGDGAVKSDPDGQIEQANVANRIRQTLFMYILDDFRPRLNIAISWLTEEWYADKIRLTTNPKLSRLPNYSRWATRLLDRLLPYLDARDKNLLIRFLSEVPAIDREMLNSVKTLSRDPERINMCILAFKYLLMVRPPAREMVVDAVEDIWREGDAQAKSATTKVLKEWRPHVLEGEEGVKKEDDRLNSMKNPLVEVKAESMDPRKGRASATALQQMNAPAVGGS